MNHEAIISRFSVMCTPDKGLVWLSTTNEAGEPHLVPVCFVKALDDRRIVIGGVFIRETERNIGSNPRVALGTAFKDDGWDGYLVKGLAKVHRDGEVYEGFRKEVLDRSGGKREIKSAIVVEVEEVYSLQPRTGRKRIV